MMWPLPTPQRVEDTRWLINEAGATWRVLTASGDYPAVARLIGGLADTVFLGYPICRVCWCHSRSNRTSAANRLRRFAPAQ